MASSCRRSREVRGLKLSKAHSPLRREQNQMSILRGNLFAKSSFHLQSKFVLLPWLRRNCSVRCSKGREYGSSMPVRYIPKKLREAEASESFSASETNPPKIRPKSRGVEKPISSDTLDYDKFDGSGSNSFRHEIKDVKMNAHGCGFPVEKFSPKIQKSFNNLHMEEKPDFNEEIGYDMASMDSQFMDELEEIDEELSAQGKHRLKECKTKTDAGKVAVELLAKRAFTAMELRKKLQAKRFPPNIIDGVLSELQERGILNDRLYAEAYSRSRWSSSSWGPRRIKQALFTKGVNRVDAENAVKDVFEDEEENGDQELKLSISKSSLNQLYMQATKQWLRSQDAPRDTRKGRMIRWLQYRGFDWGIVSVILKKLESQYPP